MRVALLEKNPTTMPSVTLSIICPVFNESKNIPLLYESLRETLNNLSDISWEFIPVDDHSTDDSLQQLRNISRKDQRVRYIRLAKNEGSHIAIAAGLMHATGKCAVVLAADLQDPPEEIPKMLQHWDKGYQIVWLVREQQKGSEGYHSTLFGKFWFWMASKLPGLSEMPATGSDMFLLDKKVLTALQNRNVRKTALPLIIRSLGFRQINLLYQKKQRLHGASKWTLGKKLRHVFNTIIAFTNFPIRLITILGFSFSGLAFGYSCFLFVHKFIAGQTVSGWHSLMIFNALAFSITTLLIGILGEYIWRIFENTKNTPNYLIEETSEENPEELPAAKTLNQEKNL